jgi:hypothetical protein
MCVQTAGGTTARNRARSLAVLQRAAKPPVDLAGRSPGADDLAVTFEPGFIGGITGQVSAFGVGEQRTQMQPRGALLNIDVHHHSGVMAVWAAGRLGVPPGLHQAHKRLTSARQRRPLICSALAITMIVFPLGDQRITMRRQGGVELRGVMVGKCVIR